MLPVSTEWQPRLLTGEMHTQTAGCPSIPACDACERYVGSLLWYQVEGSTQGQQVFGVKDSLRQPHSDTAAPSDATLFDGLLPL